MSPFAWPFLRKEKENMRSIVQLFLFCFIFITTIFANAYVVPTYRDLKPATQVMIEKQNFGAPIATLATRVLNANAGATSTAQVTVTTFAAQPDVARNLVITPGGTTADVAACVITVNGTNYFNKAISETFTFTNDQSAAVTGNKAFKTVTSVVFPANCEDGTFAATWSVGVGEKIGLKSCMDNAGDWFQSLVAGAYEATRATVSVSATDVSLNTADFAGTMNGSNSFIGYFVQNFRCSP